MLYIASALTPTPILATIKVHALTAPNSTSLVVAKPDRVEVWDVEDKGLVCKGEMEMWGTVVSVDKVEVEGARPHILVLLGPPSAHLLLLTYSPSPRPSLLVTSSIPLTPPTPTLRQAEYFTSVIAQDRVALVSLWIGVLSCIEMEVEKDKDAKKRRASIAGTAQMGDEDGRRLIFKDNFNINIREHNLLHLTFLPASSPAEPIVTFLWLSPTNNLELQARTLSLAAHSFSDLSRAIDVVSPLSANLTLTEDTDFNEVPFSAPAARRVVPIPSSVGSDITLLVIGDEHTVLYSLTNVPQSPRAIRRLSAASGTTTSPRASARRSPQTEMVSSVSKRRKSSMGTKAGGGEADKWELRPVFRVRQGFGTVLAATILDVRASGASALIGDECGRLTAIGWEFERNQGILEGATGQNGSVRVKKVEMGTASPPSSLTYIDSGHVFLSSTCGDSSLIKLAPPSSPSPSSSSVSSEARPIPGRKGKARARAQIDEASWSVVYDEDGNEWRGTHELKERWMNVAPIKDLCTVQEEGGGLSHLVVSSGASISNALRIVRSGVGLEESLSIEGIEGVEKMWSLTDASGSSRLLVSTADTTALLQIDPEVSIIDVSAGIASLPTLAAGLLSSQDVLIQVTPLGVNLWSDLSSSEAVASNQVPAENEVVSAQVSGELVLLAKRGGQIELVEASSSGLTLLASFTSPAEVSAASIIALPTMPSPVLAIGTWTNEILLYDLTQLQQGSISPTLLHESFYPSSLLLQPSASSVTSTSGVQLLAGLSDGSLVIYDIEPSGPNAQLEIKSRRTMSLGNRPVQLCAVNGPDVDGEVIRAVGLTERVSVIFNSKDRVDSSSMSRKDVIAAASIRTASSGESLVLASSTAISIVKVNSLKKLHVQTLDLGDRSVTKVVAHEEKAIVDGATIRTMDPQNGEVLQSTFLEIRDASTLTTFLEWPLKEREEVTALKSVFLLGRSYLALGTALLPSEDEGGYDDDEDLVQVKEGRLLLLNPHPAADPPKDGEPYGSWEVDVVAELKSVGPVYAIETIHGFLAAASGSKVSILRLEPTGKPSKLTEVSFFSSSFLASQLCIAPKSQAHPEDRLVLGDGMRSIIVLSIDEEDGKIVDDQRDLATHNVVAMESVHDGGDGVVIADGYSNVLTFRLREGIESAATFGLHEEVSRFVPSSFAPASTAADVLKPELIFATRTGRLGVIGELTPGAARTLDDLQRNLDKGWKGPGGIGWRSWRRGGSELVQRDMAGFVDGDFVQKFLDTTLFPPEEADKIMRGGSTHEQVSKLVPGNAGRVPAERSDVLGMLEIAGGMH